MPTAIDVQQHARQWTPLPPSAVHPAFFRSRYQPRSLQRGFHPRVAQINLVFGLQLLVKMANVQIEILLSIESQNLLYDRQRNAFRRGLAATTIEQPVVAKLLVTLPHAPHMPITKP